MINIKDGLVASKEVTTNDQFPPSTMFFGGEKEKFPFAYLV